MAGTNIETSPKQSIDSPTPENQSLCSKTSDQMIKDFQQRSSSLSSYAEKNTVLSRFNGNEATSKNKFYENKVAAIKEVQKALGFSGKQVDGQLGSSKNKNQEHLNRALNAGSGLITEDIYKNLITNSQAREKGLTPKQIKNQGKFLIGDTTKAVLDFQRTTNQKLRAQGKPENLLLTEDGLAGQKTLEALSASEAAKAVECARLKNSANVPVVAKPVEEPEAKPAAEEPAIAAVKRSLYDETLQQDQIKVESDIANAKEKGKGNSIPAELLRQQEEITIRQHTAAARAEAAPGVVESLRKHTPEQLAFLARNMLLPSGKPDTLVATTVNNIVNAAKANDAHEAFNEAYGDLAMKSRGRLTGHLPLDIRNQTNQFGFSKAVALTLGVDTAEKFLANQETEEIRTRAEAEQAAKVAAANESAIKNKRVDSFYDNKSGLMHAVSLFKTRAVGVENEEVINETAEALTRKPENLVPFIAAASKMTTPGGTPIDLQKDFLDKISKPTLKELLANLVSEQKTKLAQETKQQEEQDLAKVEKKAEPREVLDIDRKRLLHEKRNFPGVLDPKAIERKEAVATNGNHGIIRSLSASDSSPERVARDTAFYFKTLKGLLNSSGLERLKKIQSVLNNAEIDGELSNLDSKNYNVRPRNPRRVPLSEALEKELNSLKAGSEEKIALTKIIESIKAANTEKKLSQTFGTLSLPPIDKVA